MDLKQIKELMSAMERAGIKKLTVKQKGGDELHLERHDESQPPISHHATPFYPPAYVHPPMREESLRSSPVSKPQQEEPPTRKEGEEKGKYVAAPLVGTFYAAASPEDASFVKVGDRIEEDTVICIIEAMKVMNEVKAGIRGVVAEILVENAHPVEFGTKLFRII